MAWLILVLMWFFSVGQVYGDIIDTMSTNSWLEIPSSHMDAVAYPWKAGEGLQGGVYCVIACWAGGALDTKRSIMMVGPGGGHAGYNGNELYGFNLSTGVLSWSRLTDPIVNPNLIENTSGGTPNGTFCPSSIDATPCAEHSYGSIQYDPVADRYLLVPGWNFWGDKGWPSPPVWAYDPTTHTWQKRAYAPTNTSYGDVVTTGRMSAYDSVTGLMWYLGSWSGPLASYNYATNTWSNKGLWDFYGYYHTMAFDPKRRRLIVVGDDCVPATPSCNEGLSDPSIIRIYDVSNPAAGTIPSQQVASTGDLTCTKSQSPGFDYEPNSDSMICWPGTGNTVYRLNLTTFNWTAVTISNSGASPVKDPNGTFGRFRYVPARGVFVLVNATGSNVFILKTGAVVPDTQAPTIPTGLTVTVISSTQINLSWTASTDNVGGSGVASYSVRRCSPTACNPVNEVYTPTGTSQNDTGLTPNTPYGYSVAARDAAGNLSLYSPAVYATTLAAGGGADFATRCAAAGVVRCWSFTTTADLGSQNTGLNYGYFNNGGACNSTAKTLCPTIDSSVPNGPAMQFIIPSQSGSGSSGQWYGNFSANLLTQFGSKQSYYFQWRQRFSACYLYIGTDDTNCLTNAPNGVRVYCVTPPSAAPCSGLGGWKLLGVSAGDKPGCTAGGTNSTNPNCQDACTANDILTQNTNQRGFMQMYQSCTGSTHVVPYQPYEPTEVPPGGTVADILFQNARSNPGCTYAQGNTKPKTFFPPQGNCFGFFPNEWMTFKVKITLGACTAALDEWAPNRIELWIARDGQPSEKAIDYAAPYQVSGYPCDSTKMGKFWLLPYHTYKDASEVHPQAYTWYKELILSTQDIADPGATIPTPGPLSVTINTNSGNNFTTSSSSAVLTGTATGPGF